MRRHRLGDRVVFAAATTLAAAVAWALSQSALSTGMVGAITLLVWVAAYVAAVFILLVIRSYLGHRTPVPARRRR